MMLRLCAAIFLNTCLLMGSMNAGCCKNKKYSKRVQVYEMPTMQTQKGFKHILNNYPYIVAYVYSLRKGETEQEKHVENTYNLVRQYGQDNVTRYTDARVKFVGINLESGDLKELTTRYNLAAGSEYLLFLKNRKLLNTHLVKNTLTPQALEEFIDTTNLEDFVDDQLAELAREEQRIKAKSRYYRYYDDYYYGGMYGCVGYGYAGYGCCGPGYGGWGYGPYWGCGRGWGGCGGCASFGVSFAV